MDALTPLGFACAALASTGTWWGCGVFFADGVEPQNLVGARGQTLKVPHVFARYPSEIIAHSEVMSKRLVIPSNAGIQSKVRPKDTKPFDVECFAQRVRLDSGIRRNDGQEH